ncbi:hypothetical protein Btru_033460 [Bulinus truncatus]|nr:hypothetical protein Btru_033460 [Bulinus truncatus]
MLLVGLAYAVTLAHSTSSEMFTSLLKMERLIVEEGQVLETIDPFIDSQYDRLKTVNTFLSERLTEVRSKEISIDNLSHPNVAYHVIKNFAENYTDALGDNFEIFINFTKEKSSNLYLADASDVEEVQSSLARLKVKDLSIYTKYCNL